MSDFVVHGEDQKMTIQALLEGMKMARSLENLATSLLPLSDSPEVVGDLEHIEEYAREASQLLRAIYKRNAREAFGEQPLPGSTRQAHRNSDVRSVSEHREGGPSQPDFAPAHPGIVLPSGGGQTPEPRVQPPDSSNR